MEEILREAKIFWRDYRVPRLDLGKFLSENVSSPNGRSKGNRLVNIYFLFFFFTIKRTVPTMSHEFRGDFSLTALCTHKKII